MKRHVTLVIAGIFLLGAAGCGRMGGSSDSPSAPTATGPTEEAYVATDRCAIDGTKLKLDHEEVYDSANLNSGEAGGTALSKYNLLKHAGACTNGGAPRCKMDLYYISIDGQQGYSNIHASTKVDQYLKLIQAGGCDFGSGDRFKMTNYGIDMNGSEVFDLHDDIKMNAYLSLVKSGANVLANSKRCDIQGQSIRKDGAVIFTTANEFERASKFAQLTGEGQCK